MNKVTGIKKSEILGVVEAEMGCDLNHDVVEVYAANNSNSYAVRVPGASFGEDYEVVVYANPFIPDEYRVEEVEFTQWPPTEH